MDNDYARVTEIVRTVLGLEEGLVNWIRRSERSGIDTKSIVEKAATRGTKIHGYVEKTLNGKKTKIPKKYKSGIENVLEFLKGKENLKTEVALKTDDPVKFQGHLDYLYYDNGYPVVADLKTGGKRIEAELQLNGYGYLCKKNLGVAPKRLELLYFKPTYFDLVTLDYNEDLWLSLLKLYSWKKEEKNWI